MSWKHERQGTAVASKFQNRLVGTVILVAVGVIVLPGLLDGKKKHYEDEFAAIPLVPKAGDSQENDAVPPVTQSLPAQPPEGAGQAVGAASQPAAGPGTTAEAPEQRAPVTAPPVTTTKPVQPEKVAPKPAEPKPVKPVEKPKAEPKPEPKPVEKPQPKPETKPQPTDTAPAGQAYIVQLGALKNAAKVNEIVASLRLSGYRAYTVPSTPVQGQITRIFVGPDASKQKLQSALPEMNQISGLSGQVRAYSAGR